MESLSTVLSSSPPHLNHTRTQRSTSKSNSLFSNSSPNCNSISISCKNSLEIHSLPTNKTPKIPTSTNLFPKSTSFPNFHQILLQPHLSFLAAGLCFPLSCFATEETVPTEELSNKINLEAILVSIDDFFNKNPFFVAGVTFIWLVVIPLTEEYFQKYKFVSAIDAFRKLRDDPNCQLIDIRDKKSLAVLNSPNLKIINKSVMQVEFREGNEDGFVAKVLENLKDPANTTICVLDNFDGKSITVAELLVKNGFKEAYAIRGGIRGKKGWQDIQETLLPPSVHIYAKRNVKISEQLDIDGKVNQLNVNEDQGSSARSSEDISNGYIKSSIQPTSQAKGGHRSSSPYPNYPDLKPPSSPTPSKPR